jgi:hypothetical protein
MNTSSPPASRENRTRLYSRRRGRQGHVAAGRLSHDPAADARHRHQDQDREPHLRATGITAYLKNKGTLEAAQHIANHESPRTTKLYDRRQDEI